MFDLIETYPPSFFMFLHYGELLIDALYKLYTWIFILPADDLIIDVLQVVWFDLLELLPIPWISITNKITLEIIEDVLELFTLNQPLYIALCAVLIAVAVVYALVRLIIGPLTYIINLIL